MSNYCSSCVMCKSVRQKWFTKNHVILVIFSGLPVFLVFWEAISVPIRRGFPKKSNRFCIFLVLVTHYKVRPSGSQKTIKNQLWDFLISYHIKDLCAHATPPETSYMQGELLQKSFLCDDKLCDRNWLWIRICVIVGCSLRKIQHHETYGCHR